MGFSKENLIKLKFLNIDWDYNIKDTNDIKDMLKDLLFGYYS